MDNEETLDNNAEESSAGSSEDAASMQPEGSESPSSARPIELPEKPESVNLISAREKPGDKGAKSKKEESGGLEQKKKKGDRKPPPKLSGFSTARPTKIPRTVASQEQVVEREREKVKWSHLIGPLCALLLLVLAADFHGLFGTFVFNDMHNFTAVSVSQTSDTFWLKLWTDGVVHPLSQPWVVSTYAWDIKSFGSNAVFCHFVNLTLHLLTCIYLYVLIFRLSWLFGKDGRLNSSPYLVAFCATLIFGLHPLTAGCVAYISGRSALLLASSYLLALNLALFGFLADGVGLAMLYYFGCFSFMAIALFSNAQALTLPFVIIFILCLTKDPKEQWKAWLEERWYELALFSVIALCTPLALLGGAPRLTDNGVGLRVLPAVEYVASQFKLLITYYLRCLVAPFGLTVDPPMVQARGLSDPFSLLGMAFVAASLALVYKLRSQPLMLLGMLLFFAGFAPSSFMPQAELLADHRIYLSLSGGAIIIGILFARLIEAERKRGYIILGAVSAALIAGNILYTLSWKNDEQLWTSAVKLNPSSSHAHSMLARALLKQNKVDAAVKEAEQSLKIDPGSAVALQVLGIKALNEKDFKNAAKNFEAALANAKDEGLSADEIAQYQVQLAAIYDREGESKKALELAQQAIEVLPDEPKLHLILGKSLMKEKQWYRAFKTLMEGFRLDPYNPEYLDLLAESGLNSGEHHATEQAFLCAKRSMAVNPTKKATLLFARAAIELGKVGESIKVLYRLLSISGKDAEAFYLMSIACKLGNNPVQQANYLREAKKINPNIESEVPIFLGKPGKDVTPKKDEKVDAPPPQSSPKTTGPSGQAPLGAPAKP